MVLDLLTLTGVSTSVCAAEAVHQQAVYDEEAETEQRQAPFYLDVYCDASSRKRDEVHGAMVILKDGKLRLWPKDAETKLPEAPPDDSPAPHPFTGFYLAFPAEDLPHKTIPAPRMLGLVSTIPSNSQPSAKKAKFKSSKPRLNWIYADKDTRELKYGPRVEAREHHVGPWDWTEDDEQGLTLDGEECLVAVEEEKGGFGWSVYWDHNDNRLKDQEVGNSKKVLRCSLERRLVEEDDDEIEVE